MREAKTKLKVGIEAETKEEILPTTRSRDLCSQPSLYNSGAPAGGGTAHSGMNPPKSFIHQENAPQNAHRPAWWRQSLSWGSLSPRDSSLWQTDSWVWQTTLKPSLSVLHARLHSSNVFHACAMAGLIKSPSQSCLWILRYILCSPWPLDIWPSRMYTLKTSTIFFKKGSHFLVFFFFFSLPSNLRHLIHVEGGAQFNTIQLQLCGQSTVFGPGGIMSKAIQALCSRCWLDTCHGITTQLFSRGQHSVRALGAPCWVVKWIWSWCLLHTPRRNLEPADLVTKPRHCREAEIQG